MGWSVVDKNFLGLSIKFSLVMQYVNGPEFLPIIKSQCLAIYPMYIKSGRGAPSSTSSVKNIFLWIAPIIFLFSGIGSLWLVSKRVSNVRNQVEILRIDEEFESLLAEDDSRS